MKPVDQTLVGGRDAPLKDRGDCLGACIASILEVPLSKIGNHHGKGWWDRYAENVNSLGAYIMALGPEWIPLPGYWIASVPSLNVPDHLHAVVMLDRQLAHDPALGRKRKRVTMNLVEEAYILVAHDPAPGARRARRS